MSNPQTFTPITQEEDRLTILDTLRGFAVFGILMANITAFALPKHDFMLDLPDIDIWYNQFAIWFNTHFIDGKFYILFSFLFGIGFSVQLESAMKKGINLWSFYPRRLLILFGIGVLHSYFWWGDVLRLYAILGFGLLLLKNLSVKSLLLLSAGSLGLSGFLPTTDFYHDMPNPTSDDVFYSLWFALVYMAPTAFALFLLGRVAGKLAFFHNLSNKVSVLKKCLVISFIIWIGLKSALYLWVEPYSPYETIPATLRDMALTSVYLMLLCLLSVNLKTQKYLVRLTNVGRMALSNYVLHTVICVAFFKIFALEGLLGNANISLIACVIFGLQMLYSSWWLKRFHFGLLEWLWRSLTFGKWQKLVK